MNMNRVRFLNKLKEFLEQNDVTIKHTNGAYGGGGSVDICFSNGDRMKFEELDSNNIDYELEGIYADN